MINGTENNALLLTHRLKNGLHIVGQTMPDVETVSMGYFVRTGARDEQDATLSGISHFLEHMVFRGTKTRDWQQLKQEFTRIGAEKNGFTSAERTIYYLRVQSDYFDQAFRLLTEMMEPRLDENDFEQEKGVILNEIARSEDQPKGYAHRRMMRVYFDTHPLGNYVLGSRESIQEMRLEQMREYWQRWYSAKNIVLSVAGNFDWDHLIALAEHVCESWPTGDVARIATAYEPNQSTHSIGVQKHLKQQILFVSMPGIPSNDPDYYATSLGWNILGDSDGSRIHWNIQQKGLAQSASSALRAFDGTGMLFMQAHTTPENAPHVLTLLQTELKQVLYDGFDEEELQRAKNKKLSDIIFHSESTYNRMRTLGMDWLYEGRLSSLEEEAARIERVTSDEVMNALHRLPLLEKQVLTTWGPLEERDFQL